MNVTKFSLLMFTFNLNCENVFVDCDSLLQFFRLRFACLQSSKVCGNEINYYFSLKIEKNGETLSEIMFDNQIIHTEHRDVIHDCSYDYYGQVN